MISLRVAIRLPLLAVVAAIAGCTAPQARYTIPATAPSPGLAVIVHGVDSSPDSWPKGLEQRIHHLAGGPEAWQIIRLDWCEISARKLTSATNGYRLGFELGTELAQLNPPYRLMHLVAHSMGAHVIQGVADAYRPRHPDTIIPLTFLDAFVTRGPFSLFYGRRVFGRNSDFAESFVTRGEPAFLTNALLLNAHNFDVSAAVPAHRAENPRYHHIWPIDYYLESVDSDGPGLTHGPYAATGAFGSAADLLRHYDALQQRYPRGQTTPLRPD